MQAGLELFKSRVRPMLLENCLNCHGGKEKKGDFDMSTREKLMDSGMVETKAASSTMYRVAAHLDDPHMPYKAAKLPDASIGDLGRWIDLGAPYDRPLIEQGQAATQPKVVTDQDRRYWAFVPLDRPAPAGSPDRLAPRPDRSLPAGQDGDGRRDAGGRRRSRSVDPPRLFRRDRPAAIARRDRGICSGGRFREGLGSDRRQAPGQPAFWRALGAALARLCPLRREHGLRA